MSNTYLGEITVIEHETGFWKAVSQYPAATFWSAFFCIAVIMAGFDAQIITSFYALPAFQRKYGELVVHNGVESYEVPAEWQVSNFQIPSRYFKKNLKGPPVP
jgi:MFS transporter, SP family, general alpha glucoside:H+ symporter